MKKTNQRLFYPQKVKRQLFCALVACVLFVQYLLMPNLVPSH